MIPDTSHVRSSSWEIEGLSMTMVVCDRCCCLGRGERPFARTIALDTGTEA